MFPPLTFIDGSFTVVGFPPAYALVFVPPVIFTVTMPFGVPFKSFPPYMLVFVPPFISTVTLPQTRGIAELFASPCPPPKMLAFVPEFTTTCVLLDDTVVHPEAPCTVPQALPPSTLTPSVGLFPPPWVPIVTSTVFDTSVCVPLPPP